MSVFIGIDTSCYTTSVASADAYGNIIASNRILLQVPAGGRGLRQSEAVFGHIHNLPHLYRDVLEALDTNAISAVCVSVSPRDAKDSYMPVFKAGEAFASVAAATLHVPLYFTSHQRGHIRAALISSGLASQSFIALHLSGGTTEVIQMNQGALTLLGGTDDLSAGQLVDRIAVALELPFPGGPALEQLALAGNDHSIIPVCVNGMSCHFSGAEAQALRWIKNGELPFSDIAAEVFGVIARTAARLLTQAGKQTGIHEMLVMGGVASSALFRSLLHSRIEKRGLAFHVHFGLPQYSGDNAAGIALMGLQYYQTEKGKSNAGNSD
jgi:N6-L-threonylcarbamoyladenine synthase